MYRPLQPLSYKDTLARLGMASRHPILNGLETSGVDEVKKRREEFAWVE